MRQLGPAHFLPRRITRGNSKVSVSVSHSAFMALERRLISLRAAYLKKVVEKLKEGGADEDKISAFQKKVQNYYSKKIAPNFGDFDFYTGESMTTDGM